MIRIERATEIHAQAIGPRLRIYGCSEEELRRGPEIAQRHLEASIEAWAWIDEGKPLAIAGVISRSLLGGVGAVWLLATPEAFVNRRVFWRSSKALVAYLRHQYVRLEGRVDVEHAASMRWLKRLGFHVIETPYEFDGRTFMPFVMER